MRLPISSIFRLNNKYICSLRRQGQNQYEPRTAQGQYVESGAFERARTESTSRTRDFNDLQHPPGPKWSLVRTIRLLFNGSRLFFDITLIIILSHHDGVIIYAIIDITIAGFLILWDLLEKFCLKSDSPYTTTSKISISIEVAIPIGIVVMMYFVIIYQDIDYLGLDIYNPIHISTTLLWVPVVIISGVLIYHLVRSYIQRRHDRKIRPIVVFTRTGDPVAVMPRARPPNDSASRISIDSLIQTSEEPSLQEVRVL